MTQNARYSIVFYGYVIVAAAFLITAVGWGANRTFGIFLPTLTQEFGWTRAGISGSFTICMVVLGIITLTVGRLTDRLGPRPLLIACSFFMGVGFLMCSQIESLWELYVYFGIFTGIGLSGVYVPMYSIVARWFVQKRSLMTGILAAGPPTGIVLMPPVTTWLMSRFGWRDSFTAIGIFTFLALLTTAMFLKRDPGQIGTTPLGAEKASGTWNDIQNHGMLLQEAVRTRSFWLLNLISFIDAVLVNVVIVHLVPYAISLHIDPLQAATVLSLAAGVSIPARIGMGGLADRIGNHQGLFVCISTSILAFTILIFARGSVTLYLFAVLYGIGLWTSSSVMSPFIADLFGLKSHGAILACTSFSWTIGGGLGPVLVGFIFDLTGSYQLGFWVCLSATIISLISLLGIKSPLSGSICSSMRS